MMNSTQKNSTQDSEWVALREILQAAVTSDCLVAVHFRKPNSASANSSSAEKAKIRPIATQRGRAFQCTKQVAQQALHQNHDAAAVAEVVCQMLQEEFSASTIQTTTADFIVKHKSSGRLKIQKRKPTTTEVIVESHNRERSYLIPDGTACPFLIEIGVMSASGNVKKPMYHKFRQINRFAELVNDVVDSLPETGPLRVLDFGCGKSYLTFALHHLLTEVRQRSVEIFGLDRRPDVIETCRTIANKLQLNGLTFHVGDIATAADNPQPVDLAVSLHACDTATDDALLVAIRRQAQVILSVPCCQHELAPQLETEGAEGILEHGLFRERMGAIATDALRASALQACGYQTQIVEFIDLEHTAKNVLIRAVRNVESVDTHAALKKYEQLKSFLGLTTIHLDKILADNVATNVSALAKPS